MSSFIDSGDVEEPSKNNDNVEVSCPQNPSLNIAVDKPIIDASSVPESVQEEPLRVENSGGLDQEGLSLNKEQRTRNVVEQDLGQINEEMTELSDSKAKHQEEKSNGYQLQQEGGVPLLKDQQPSDIVQQEIGAQAEDANDSRLNENQEGKPNECERPEKDTPMESEDSYSDQLYDYFFIKYGGTSLTQTSLTPTLH